MSKSSYTYKVEKGFVLIEDHDQEMSVTNNIRNVLKEIANKEQLSTFKDWNLIYKDTTGNWDGINTTGINFQSFYPIGTKSSIEAMEFVRTTAKE